jgi:hypothetical protein
MSNKERAIGEYDPSQEWRKELGKMMATWHFSIQKIEQFMVETIEREILRAQNKRK